MLLKSLKVENYRSLRNIEFRPGNLTVVVGANGAGKSNLASAIDFLSQAYESGLEYAVMAKGGFENIAFRSIRRTKSAIKFSSEFALPRLVLPMARGRPVAHPGLLKHSFAIKTAKEGIGADYKVVEETIELYRGAPGQALSECDHFPLLFSVTRKADVLTFELTEDGKSIESLPEYLDFLSRRYSKDLSNIQLAWRELTWLSNTRLNGMAVHQLSPNTARAPGPPSPDPTLTAYGQNLAALVDWLKKHHPKKWVRVEDSMKQIVPGLVAIEVVFSMNNLLTLTFKEEHAGKAWTAQDVSDGTIQTLAILCVMADPRTQLLLLEEPENSVHPWIVRQLAHEFKRYARTTQVVLTTHSPLILNMVEAEDVWVCYKKGGETILANLPILRPEVVEDWKAGNERLFDLFDMGLVQEAMPTGQIS
jgi:predicted ATPase